MPFRSFLQRYTERITIAWAGFILLLCAIPGPYIPSAGWMELLSLDKWVHAFLFFVLNSLFLLQCLKRKKGLLVMGCYTLLCILYGIGLEVMQARIFVERAYDELDMLANGIGALLVIPFRKRVSRGFLPAQP